MGANEKVAATFHPNPRPDVPGWYPAGDGRQRWWNGRQWTETYRAEADVATEVIELPDANGLKLEYRAVFEYPGWGNPRSAPTLGHGPWRKSKVDTATDRPERSEETHGRWIGTQARWVSDPVRTSDPVVPPPQTATRDRSCPFCGSNPAAWCVHRSVTDFEDFPAYREAGGIGR